MGTDAVTQQGTLSESRLEKVRRRAYDLWQQEGESHGRHEDHWAEAERQIDAEDTLAAEKSESPARVPVAPTPSD